MNGPATAVPKRRARRAGRAALAAVLLSTMLALGNPPDAVAVPLAPEELAKLCGEAEGTAHCGRLVEAVQLKRLPNLATRDGALLKVQLYPTGAVTLADTDAVNGGRSYSLWDYLDPINAVLLYATDGDAVSFVLLQRATGRRVTLPTEPKVSPDRQRLVTADFCPTQCVNELAVWRVTRDGIHKEAVWKPAETWIDAGATWRDPETIAIDYTAEGAGKSGVQVRKLSDPGWRQLPRP